MPYYGYGFVSELLTVYNLSVEDSSTHRFSAPSWEPQRLYSDIITDATTLCPSLHLASTMSRGASQPVYLVGTSQRMSTAPGFCALEAFNHFQPSYCPKYSFHAVDMFSLFQPFYDAKRFKYHFSDRDKEYGRLIWKRLIEFAKEGRVREWPHFDVSTGVALDLATPERAVPGYRAHECAFWLKHGFYDKIGLIN